MIRVLLWGLFAFLGLIFFYFLVMGLASRSWSATILQFEDLKFWILAISFGFGVQVGLYTGYRQKVEKARAGHKMLAASGTTSAVSLVACCAHHLTEVLPLLGFSAFSLFLTNYQKPILALSLAINVLGIVVMVKHLRRLNLPRNGARVS